jgi:heptose I phosphotransferase
MSRSSPVEFYIRDDVRSLIPADNLLTWAQSLEGDVARAVARRRTLKVTLGQRHFYLKIHQGVGWLEIVKNWLNLKAPVLGARNEYLACRHLEASGIAAPRVAAYARSGGSAANESSFVLCDELSDYQDLESLTQDWSASSPSGAELRLLVMQAASIARRLHAAGVVHRDFYICHLLKSTRDASAELAVLDLHRALIFTDGLPLRWRRRDLAALLYSVLALPLTRRAWLRFVRAYTGVPLQQTFADQGAFWESVYRRALRLQAKGERKGLTGPFAEVES